MAFYYDRTAFAETVSAALIELNWNPRQLSSLIEFDSGSLSRSLNWPKEKRLPDEARRKVLAILLSASNEAVLSNPTKRKLQRLAAAESCLTGLSVLEDEAHSSDFWIVGREAFLQEMLETSAHLQIGGAMVSALNLLSFAKAHLQRPVGNAERVLWRDLLVQEVKVITATQPNGSIWRLVRDLCDDIESVSADQATTASGLTAGVLRADALKVDGRPSDALSYLAGSIGEAIRRIRESPDAIDRGVWDICVRTTAHCYGLRQKPGDLSSLRKLRNEVLGVLGEDKPHNYLADAFVLEGLAAAFASSGESREAQRLLEEMDALRPRAEAAGFFDHRIDLMLRRTRLVVEHRLRIDAPAELMVSRANAIKTEATGLLPRMVVEMDKLAAGF